MPEGDKFVTAGAFLENAKPRSMKMSEFFNLQEKKKANSTKIQDFWDQVVEKKAKADKADKAAKEAQEALEAKAKAEAEKEARAQQKSGRALSEEDDIPMTFGDPSDEVEEEAPEAEKKSLYREVRDVLYKEGEYEGMNALARRLADIRVMAQIVRAGYVEGKREARDWFYHTKFGQAVKDKSETLKKFGSTCLDYAAAGYKGMKNLVSTGAEKTKKGLKAAYQFVAERAKVAKERFVNTPEVQWASRKMRQYDEMVSAAGKSMARGFRKLFGIRELTEEEKKQRAEEKRKKAEEKEAKKNQEKTEKEAKKKEEKSAKEKLKAEKKAEKEFQKKLKALKKAMEAEKDPSKLEKMAADFKEATVNGLASLGDRYDELMKTIDLSVQSQVQKDDIDEIIRRRADKSYDKRMKEFKRWLHEDPDKDKKLKYRLNSDQWKEEFEAAKKRAEEEKKKKQNGGKAAEDKKEEVKKEEVKKEETKAEGEKETEKKEPEKKEEKQLGIIESIDNLAGKISTTKKKLDKIKKGQIGSGADLVKDLQNFKTAFSNLQTELKKKKEEEEQKKAEAEAKTEEKTEAQAENTTESTEKTEEKTETKTEEKSKLQQIKEKTKEIADNTVKAVGTAYTDIKTGIAIQENVGTIVDDVQKLVSGQGSEKEAAEAIKKSTDTLKKAGSFFGWDPSKGTAYVDKGADTLALFGKTRQDLTDRMKKIKEGKASAEDYLAFETGLSTLAQNCLSYANIDTPYINSFNKALTGMVKISKGEKVTENILNVGQQLLSTANAIEKQITGTGSLGTPIAILGSMEKIAGNMESLVEKTEQNQRLKGMSGEEIGKGVTKEEAGLISNVRDDIVGRNDISRYQLLGGAVKSAAETTAAVVGGTIGTLYMKAAQPAFDALNRFMTEAMTKSLNKALIRKDIWGTEDNYRIDREMKGMRNDEIMRILRRETGSINGQHLADKIRFDLGMRLMTNADKNNGFEALVQNAFGRKATDEEIMQLVGFKDFKDAENRVYKAVENDNKLKSDFTKKGKDVLAKPSKAEKEQAKKDKAYQNILDELNNILDTDESPALLAEDEKKKIPLFPEDNKKNKTSFKDTHASKKHKEKGL